MENKYKIQIKKLEDLNSQWKAARPNYNFFVDDGILNYDLYNQGTPKIMFFLKESNADFNPISPLPIGHPGYGPKGNSNTFWRYMKGYEHIIQNAWANIIYDEKKLFIIKEQPNNSIAYVNIKKQCDNNATSSNNDLNSYLERDKDFLTKQIDLIDPNVIYCAGTFNFYERLDKNLEMISDNVFKSGNRIIINFLHLAHRRGYKTFRELHNLLNQANLSNTK